MFDRTARWYDAFYAHVDYEAEAEEVTAVIRELNPGARSLLDVACGTGRHLARFRRHFDCAGADVESAMVAVARETLPGVPLEVADMAELDLGLNFDAVTCLFSSIGYMVQPERLDRAVRAMAGQALPRRLRLRWARCPMARPRPPRTRPHRRPSPELTVSIGAAPSPAGGSAPAPDRDLADPS